MTCPNLNKKQTQIWIRLITSICFSIVNSAYYINLCYHDMNFNFSIIFNQHEVKNILQYCHFSELEITLKSQTFFLFMWFWNHTELQTRQWGGFGLLVISTTVVKFPSRNKMGVLSGDQEPKHSKKFPQAFWPIILFSPFKFILGKETNIHWRLCTCQRSF